ncbi:Benzene 1,2-dioxygenase subunit alpha [Aquisphaera giovannonii]|uniref:Benzene 1,2-dioxygenase subunit alpha n=1 Tax=Aquisphaera giovannonii TaxID=406548 RepID=A0A5B9W922_9BACT|nr:aromatic ring-hydroxylating dioxygenase subunit alpha [Aquisphaera giovannonii]QEH36370.1 Benzene 1,2-dioxygenase subunit alpha [Aquisphaera giovannonii]
MSTDAKARASLPADALSLPGWYYTDSEHFRREMDRFFAGGWVHAGRAEEIPTPGDFVLREVAGESLILVRGDDSTIRAFYNVCRHRGTRLCEAASGNCGGFLRCPYHAWAFDLAGRLVAAPQMDDLPHFCREDYPLIGAAASTWDGHVFVSLAESPRPLEDALGDLPGRLRPWGMDELRLGRRTVYDVAANWKLIIQNYSECLHCPGVHPALQRLSHFLSGENDPANESYLGGRMSLREGIETLSMDGARRRPFLPGLSEADRRLVLYYAILPNLLLSLHPDYVMTHTLHPRSVGRTEVVCEWHFHPEAMSQPDFSPEDAASFWDMTNRQDWHVCEQMQLGVASRAHRPGPYSNREDLLHGFDRLVRVDG